MWATSCPLCAQQGWGPRRGCKIEIPQNQDYSRERHHPQLSGVAQERDPRSIPYACDGITGCHQEAWYFKDYDRVQKAYVEAKTAVQSAEAGLALLNGTGARSKKIARRKPWQKLKKPQKNCQRSPCKDPRIQVRNQGSWRSDWGDQQHDEGWLPSWSWEGHESCWGCQGRNDRCRKPDVCFLFKLAFSLEQVLMEQDRQQADGKQPIWCGACLGGSKTCKK